MKRNDKFFVAFAILYILSSLSWAHYSIYIHYSYRILMVFGVIFYCMLSVAINPKLSKSILNMAVLFCFSYAAYTILVSLFTHRGVYSLWRALSISSIVCFVCLVRNYEKRKNDRIIIRIFIFLSYILSFILVANYIVGYNTPFSMFLGVFPVVIGTFPSINPNAFAFYAMYALLMLAFVEESFIKIIVLNMIVTN